MKITVHSLADGADLRAACGEPLASIAKSGTGFTSRALVIRVGEAAAEQGRAFQVKTVDGALRYIVDGSPYTPGAAAELLGVEL
jgi:hypothetical protein